VMTDHEGALVDYTSGPASSGQRLHLVTDHALPGIDERIVVEAYRSSCLAARPRR
jgi:hypothetical protein